MILDKQQQKGFEAAVQPLIKWLNENCHPYVVAIITPSRAELHEGIPIGWYVSD